MDVVIEVGGNEVEAVLDEELAPDTVKALAGILPFSGGANIWQEEVYFEVPVDVGPENQTPTVSKGDLAYYPPMQAFCIFFGDSQPIGPVNPVGRVQDPDAFRDIKDGDIVTVEQA